MSPPFVITRAWLLSKLAFSQCVLMVAMSLIPLRAADDVLVPIGSYGVVESRMTIALGERRDIVTIVPIAVTPPIAVLEGTRLKFVPSAGGTIALTLWDKNGSRLNQTGATLEIASATPADSGVYQAFVKRTGEADFTSEAVKVVVTGRKGQRLLNTSTRGQIGSAQPFILMGFVIEPGTNDAATLLMIRAVGPTLGTFGVTGALGTPQLRVFDARGVEVPTSNFPFTFPSLAESTRRTGAFTLLEGGKDVANLYFLPQGAYTAMLSSADGGSGTALMEVYEVPY